MWAVGLKDVIADEIVVEEELTVNVADVDTGQSTENTQQRIDHSTSQPSLKHPASAPHPPHGVRRTKQGLAARLNTAKR